MTDLSFEILMIGDHVWPRSVERITFSVNWFGEDCFPEPLAASKTSMSVPSGSTEMMLPIVAIWAFDGRRFRGVDQVAPPLLVIENIRSPRKPEEWAALRLVFSPGFVARSQTA